MIHVSISDDKQRQRLLRDVVLAPASRSSHSNMALLHRAQTRRQPKPTKEKRRRNCVALHAQRVGPPRAAAADRSRSWEHGRRALSQHYSMHSRSFTDSLCSLASAPLFPLPQLALQRFNLSFCLTKCTCALLRVAVPTDVHTLEKPPPPCDELFDHEEDLPSSSTHCRAAKPRRTILNVSKTSIKSTSTVGQTVYTEHEHTNALEKRPLPSDELSDDEDDLFSSSARCRAAKTRRAVMNITDSSIQSIPTVVQTVCAEREHADGALHNRLEPSDRGRSSESNEGSAQHNAPMLEACT